MRASGSISLLVRAASAIAVAAMPVTALTLAQLAHATTGAGITSIDNAVVVAAAVVGAVAAAHLTVTALVVMASIRVRRLRRVARRVAPAAWRRIVVGAIGGALTTTAAMPAAALDGDSPGWLPAPSPSASVAPEHGGAAASDPHADDPSPAPSPSPSSPSTAREGEPDNGSEHESATGPEASHRSSTATPASHQVERGQSLWTITADFSPDASTAEIANLWPQLYEQNRELIGADPSLIHPGQRLTLPTGWSS